MVKTSSIILMGLGALVIILTIIPLAIIPGIDKISKPTLLIIGMTLIIVGVLLMKPSKSKGPVEIPVYNGQTNEILAYRRPAKK